LAVAWPWQPRWTAPPRARSGSEKRRPPPTPLRRRTAVLKYETGKNPFPFDATLDDLGGQILQVRDEAGDVLLASSFPSFE